jgi:ankyrin repeat protein
MSPLHLAAKYDLGSIVSNILSLLEEDAQGLSDAVNIRDRRGYRPLHYSALNDALSTGQSSLSLLSSSFFCIAPLPSQIAS